MENANQTASIDDLEDPLGQVIEGLTTDLKRFDEEAVTSAALREERLSAAIQISAESLVPHLETVADLAIFSNHMRAFAGGWSHVSYGTLAISLVRHALKAGVPIAIEDLQRYVDSDTFPVQQLLLVSEINIEKPIELSNGISLIPFFPQNTAARRLIPGADDPGVIATNRISAAFSKKYQHIRLHQPYGVPDLKPAMTELYEFGELEDALLCASSLGPSGPSIIATSIAPLNWAPTLDSSQGQIPFAEEAGPHLDVTEATLEKLQIIHRHFIALREPFRDQLRTAMRRLNLAMRRRWKVDAAIDIGIALELLFSDKNSRANSIGFNLRLRAPRLLRQSESERIAMAEQVRLLYKLRSVVAHTGTLPPVLSGVQSTDILKSGAAIASEAIGHLIVNGQPDWDKVVYG